MLPQLDHTPIKIYEKKTNKSSNREDSFPDIYPSNHDFNNIFKNLISRGQNIENIKAKLKVKKSKSVFKKGYKEQSNELQYEPGGGISQSELRKTIMDSGFNEGF